MPSEERVQALKERWLNGPQFNLENTAGFEARKWELYRWRKEQENRRKRVYECAMKEHGTELLMASKWVREFYVRRAGLDDVGCKASMQALCEAVSKIEKEMRG